MTKTYTTINGMIVGETVNGIRRGFLHDANGSVVATVTSDGQVENRYWYKPFGELLAKTGSGPDPRFLWRGGLATRYQNTRFAENYGYSRHYAQGLGTWTSPYQLDPPFGSYSIARTGPADMGPSPLAGVRLTYEATPEAHALDCKNGTAGFEWKITWKLVGQATPGFIVQHVVMKEGASKCDREPVPKIKKPFYPLWEAWQVTASNGQATIWGGFAANGEKPGTDTFGVGLKELKCQKYRAEIVSTACFFPGLTPASLSSPRWEVTHGPPTYDLPATNTQPAFWKDRKNCVTRKLMYSAMCCLGCGCFLGFNFDYLDIDPSKPP